MPDRKVVEPDLHWGCRLYDEDDALLYIGCTCRLKNRLAWHRKRPYGPRAGRLFCAFTVGWVLGVAIFYSAKALAADVALTGPCTPANTQVVWAEPAANESWNGHASGIEVHDEHNWTLARCEITLDPVAWRAMGRGERCSLLAHEFGHLYFARHTATGLMAPTSDGQWFEPCRTVRERVERQLATGPHVSVICGKGRSVFFCRTFRLVRGVQREARYRVRVKGTQYTIKRVRDHT